MIPTPRIGDTASFTRVRQCLGEAGFTEARVAQWAGVESIHLFQSLHDGRKTGADIQNPLDLLVALFMDSVVVEDATIARFIPAPVVEDLRALQLLMPASGRGRSHATVLLYPVEGLYIISDLTRDPDPAKAIPLAEDVVYPAITTSSGRFLRQISRTPSERFLEMCAGTGIAALIGARRAGHAWSLDITERSTHFARFNAALNGITNFTALQGDLYEPVQGLTFDRIVAHPPYVPAPEQKIIYRDGGHDGEQITRRILAGLPQYLAPGGRYQCTCVASDRTGARLEERIREMIGPEHGEFDVLLSTALEYEPIGYFTRTALDNRMEWSTLEATLRTQRKLEVERMVYSHIEVQRRAAPRRVFTQRRALGPANGWTETDWLLKWETAMVAGDGALPRTLLAGRPSVAAATLVQLELRQVEGSWTPLEAGISIDWPYPVRVKCPPWSAELLAQCDGQSTLEQLFGRLQASGALPAEGAEAGFLQFILMLTGAGILLFDAYPLPARTPSAETQHPVA
jgi:methylase of polypeptide subunit release factors